MAFLEDGRAKEERGEPEVHEARPLHTESPYRPEPQPVASAEDLTGPTRREQMSPMREQIARHMLDSRRSLGALHDDRRGRLLARRPPAPGAARDDGSPRRQPHLPRLRRPGGRRGPGAAPGPQRLDRRRGDRLPRPGQPRHRRRARERLDRARDPPGASGSASRAWRLRSATSRPARARSGCSPTTCRAGRSRSPTRASSGRCSRRRSSTSPRSRSSTWRRSSSGRSSSSATATRRSRSARCPTSACPGTTGRSTAPRRPASSPR